MLAKTAIDKYSQNGYPHDMEDKNSSHPPKKPKRKAGAPEEKAAPKNRIAEVARERGMTYAEIAERTDAHPVTIAKLATGKLGLTQEWMNRLGLALNVEPQDLIVKPSHNLRRVTVRGYLKAGYWAEMVEWDREEWYDVFVPDEPRDRRVSLYGGQISGPSMNKRYADGSVVILTPVVETGEQLVPGRRYHVRRTRADGLVEETIKTFIVDAKGDRWFKPESDDPNHQSWISALGEKGEIIEVIGRVTYSVQRED